MYRPRAFDPFRTITTREETCLLVILQQHKLSGELGKIVRECWSYWCERCGPKRLQAHDEALRKHLAPHEELFIAEGLFSETDLARIRKRINRRHGDWLNIKHSPGTVYILATVNFAGRKGPFPRSHTRLGALALTLKRLRSPLLTKVTSSRRWRMANAEPRGQGLWARIGKPCSIGTWEKTEREARAIYEGEGGTHWPAAEPFPCDVRGPRAAELFLEAQRRVSSQKAEQ